MDFYLNKSTDSEKQYVIKGEITIENFFSMVRSFAKYVGVKPGFTSAPEAEFATIVLAEGKIFLKYDLVDGMEIVCIDLCKERLLELENFLSVS